jgi:hypothetical protein
MNLWKRAAGAALVAFCLGSAGCVSKPTVMLDHAEVRAASFTGVGLEVFLKIHNGNAYDVEVRNVHAEVTIAGKFRLDPIDVQPNKWLPSGETTVVSVPLAISWAIVPALVGETLGSPEVKYHVTGSADVTATRTFGIEKNNYPVDEDGTLPRQVFLEASPAGITIGTGQ